MKFSLNPIINYWRDRQERLENWHAWFAWYPVCVNRETQTYVWLSRVYRQRYDFYSYFYKESLFDVIKDNQ